MTLTLILINANSERDIQTIDNANQEDIKYLNIGKYNLKTSLRVECSCKNHYNTFVPLHIEGDKLICIQKELLN